MILLGLIVAYHALEVQVCFHSLPIHRWWNEWPRNFPLQFRIEASIIDFHSHENAKRSTITLNVGIQAVDVAESFCDCFAFTGHSIGISSASLSLSLFPIRNVTINCGNNCTNFPLFSSVTTKYGNSLLHSVCQNVFQVFNQLNAKRVLSKNVKYSRQNPIQNNLKMFLL